MGNVKTLKTHGVIKDIAQINKKSRSDIRGTTKITIIVPPIDQDKFENNRNSHDFTK